MMKHILAAALLIIGCSTIRAEAQTCATYPYTLMNGQTADANQVMANFNTVRNCVNSNALAKSNNLSDVSSASTSRSNLGLGAAAVENLGGNVVDDGSGNLHATNGLNIQVFTSTGTFTAPAGTTTATLYKISVLAGGGGGGGASGSNYAAGGGAAGTYGVGWFSGVAAAQTMAVTVGAAGTGGASNGTGIGGTGGSSTVAAPNSTTIINCSGGGGGTGAHTAGANAGAGGGAGGCTITASGSGLTLVTSLNPGNQGGGFGLGPYFSGAGGSNPLAPGGYAIAVANAVGITGGLGAGGGGSVSTGSSEPGGAGGAGVVIFEWVQ